MNAIGIFMDLYKVTGHEYKMIPIFMVYFFSKVIFISLDSDRIGGLGFSQVNIMKGICSGVSVIMNQWI